MPSSELSNLNVPDPDEEALWVDVRKFVQKVGNSDARDPSRSWKRTLISTWPLRDVSKVKAKILVGGELLFHTEEIPHGYMRTAGRGPSSQFDGEATDDSDESDDLPVVPAPANETRLTQTESDYCEDLLVDGTASTQGGEV